MGRQEQNTRRCSKTEIDAVHVVPALPDLHEEADDDGSCGDPIIVSEPPPRLEAGRLIEGRLRILRLLGRGGMSEVYQAYDEQAKRTVAIKLMLAEQKIDAQLAIFAEARSLLGFHHPHVVGFFGVGAVDGQPFIELEEVSGGSLAERMHTEGMLPIADAMDILIKAAEGLAALHAAGIVHRDVKADNVLLTDDGRPVIADFGLAMHLENLPALPNGIVGTPAYMAPEAILGITDTFVQYAYADQYSFAVTVYFAVTGTLPFDAATPSGLFYAQMALDPDRPSMRCPAVSPELDEVLLRALAKRPSDRLPSMHDFRDALVAVRATLGPSLPKVVRESGVRSVPAPSLKPTVVSM